ncbi:transcription factor MYB86-like [Iris pallida]|uniref:Transcription factor MYB86-like n=1 Tax=Iris pallida TaxID=29817 RepID=A0AAX6FG21_IRIPA|nr:transcription factor MYB86-like [Iris pallida]
MALPETSFPSSSNNPTAWERNLSGPVLREPRELVELQAAQSDGAVLAPAIEPRTRGHGRAIGQPKPASLVQPERQALDMNPEYGCNTLSTVIPSVSSSMLSTPMGLKTAISLPPDNPPPECYWEAGNTVTAAGAARIVATELSCRAATTPTTEVCFRGRT